MCHTTRKYSAHSKSAHFTVESALPRRNYAWSRVRISAVWRWETTQIAPPQMRKAKGNSPHPKRGSRKPIRPTSKRAYYCTFIEPTPKVRILRSSGQTLDQIARGPGFKSGHFLGQTRPTQFILAPLLPQLPTPMYNSAVARNRGGANWFLSPL